MMNQVLVRRTRMIERGRTHLPSDRILPLPCQDPLDIMVSDPDHAQLYEYWTSSADSSTVDNEGGGF